MASFKLIPAFADGAVIDATPAESTVCACALEMAKMAQAKNMRLYAFMILLWCLVL